MADPTVPWGIPLFDDNTPFAPIQAPFNSQSAALNDALNTIGADTGWVSVTLSSGIDKGNGLGVRRIGKTVYMRGAAIRSAGNYAASYTQALVIPSGFRPPYFFRTWAGGYASGAAGSLIANFNSNGSVEIAAVGNSSDTAFLTLSYLID